MSSRRAVREVAFGGDEEPEGVDVGGKEKGGNLSHNVVDQDG